MSNDYHKNRRTSVLLKNGDETYLTPREVEILNCLVDGLAVKEAAAKLNCALQTAWVHVQAIRKKFKSRSNFEMGYLFAQCKQS
jgi:DNA-binding NarL/FixJ family response regulator